MFLYKWYSLFVRESKESFAYLGSKSSTQNPMARHNETGKIGEELAVQFLQTKAYQILEQNWRYSRAEIDIIAKDGDVLVFIEVKTRSTDAFGKPEAFVTPKKKQFLQTAANVYMEEIGHDWEIRFDIISILLHPTRPAEVTHFEDAFFE